MNWQSGLSGCQFLYTPEKQSVMRKPVIFLGILLTLLSMNLSAQIHNPVKWITTHEQTADGEFDLIFTATIDDGWSIYSQYLESDDGPVRTSFEFEKDPGYSLSGKNVENGDKKEGYDELFGMNVIKFQHKVVFTQKIKITDYSKPIIGYFEFMTCDATKCLPPDMIDFEFTLENKMSGGAGATTEVENGTGSATKEIVVTTPTVPNVTPTAPQVVSAPEPAKPVIVKKEPAKVKTTPIKKAETSSPSKVATTPPAPIEPQADIESGLLDPVKWSLKIDKVSDDTYDLTYQAKLDKGWYVYSQYLASEDGPQKTEFNYDPSDVSTLVGKNEEISDYRIAGFDKFFDMEVIKFKKQVQFKQRIKTTDATKVVKGYLLFMTCDDGQCLPPTDVSFYVEPGNLVALTGAAADQKINPVVAEPTHKSATAKFADGKIDQKISMISDTYKKPLGDCGEEDDATGQSTFWMFAMGFAGGLLALLTPCVFPMIPLTVSFFTAGSKDRKTGIKNGLIYGASIIVIYVSIGLLFTAMFGPEVLNFLSTHWIPNTLFFLIFIVFALSFFGYFEITLPSSWTNKTDSMADKGGLIGTFFMAFTLALVSFSCTGPIIGTALVQSATSSSIGPFFVMLGFSMALALPFGLFAAFPAWLNSLPSSGGWMTSVKVVLGFLELAFAFKFLSVADMTEGWGFLRYEVFMAIWILLAIGLTLYLFGYIRFPHDSPIKKLSLPRTGLALASLALTVYLATGFMINEKTKAYNSLSMLSGIAPPANYNFFLEEEVLSSSKQDLKKRFKSFTKCANDLDCFKDYYEGMTYSQEINKPVLLDFTGHGCVNCRKTEEHIWIDDQVWDKINEDYILISLYVDDRKKLDEVFISKYTNKKLRNVGNKWTDFQIVNFQQNSQPLYVLMSPDEKVMAAPRGFKEGIQDYADFLDCGLNTFRNLKGVTGMK